MGNKVVCSVCKNQTGGFCAFKKSKVKINKRRMCDKFVYDVNKVSIKIALPSVKRPELFWDRKERRRVMKEMLNELKEQTEKKTQQIEMVNVGKDTKHPLTGDLSRFITTAGKDEEEKS